MVEQFAHSAFSSSAATATGLATGARGLGLVPPPAADDGAGAAAETGERPPKGGGRIGAMTELTVAAALAPGDGLAPDGGSRV